MAQIRGTENSSICSLMDMCIENIVSNRVLYCLLVLQNDENPFQDLNPTLKNSLLRALKRGNTKQQRGSDFLTSSGMMAMCLQEETTTFTVPDRHLGKKHPRYLRQYDWLMDDIVAAAPNVQHLRLGETLPKLLNIKLDAIVKFSKKLNSFRSLQMLDAKHLKCTSKQLKLIASNAPNLRTLKVDLNIQAKNFKCEGLLALKNLCHLEKFQFGCAGQKFTNRELKYVSVCLNQMPKLKSVGRDLKAFVAEQFKLADRVPNYYHDFLGIDCPVKMVSGHVPLKLKEVFTTADYLQKTKNLKILLPKLKRMHIKYDTNHLEVPDTVSEIGLYCNTNPRLLKTLSTQLRVLILHRCDLTRLRSNDIMTLCPNLEELTVHKCYTLTTNIVGRQDMRLSRLRKLTLSSFTNSTSDGLLSRLLRAPQLEHVHVTGYSAQPDELESLIRKVREGRILINVQYCLMRGDCFRELLMNVRALCPKVNFVSS